MKVVRFKPYLRACKSMALDEAGMRAIEHDIAIAPDRNPMMKGLRGVRKARIALAGRGKRGGGRAVYYVTIAFGSFHADGLSEERAGRPDQRSKKAYPRADRRHQGRDDMTRVGDDLVEAFTEMAAYLRGDELAESYDLGPEILTAERIRAIRRSVATSTKAFEAEFHIPARTIESYEQGRRKPDAATTLLFRVLEKEPGVVRRVVSSAGRS